MWLFLCMAGGCTQTEVEENDIPLHALKEVEAGFSLHVLANQTPATRSVEEDTLQTRAETALTEIQESQIVDLWIGQYDATTGNRLSGQYIESLTGDNTVNLKLKQTRNGTESHVWFIANSGNLEEKEEIATESALKERVLTYSFTDAGLPSSQLCGMTGMWTGVVKEGGVKNIKVDLTRLLAKITFTYTIGGTDFSFKPSSVTLNSVPEKSQVAAPNKQLSAATYGTYSGTESESGATMCWYLPENRAGTVSDSYRVDSELKKVGNGVSHATYIELTGDAVQAGVNYKGVTFRFYPGSGPNNYDIIRNYHYKMNVTLIGIDASDERITVDKIPSIEVDTDPLPAAKGGTKDIQITARPGQSWSFEMPSWLSALLDGEAVSGTTVTHQGPSKLTLQTVESNPKVDERSADIPIDVNGVKQMITVRQNGSTLVTGADIFLDAEQYATGNSSFTATQGLAWNTTLTTFDGDSWLDWATGNPSVPASESTGEAQTLTVRSTSPNPLAEPRHGTITVTAGESVINASYTDLKKVINITQAASTVTSSSSSISAEAHKEVKSSFTATAGLSWQASVAGDSWITVSTKSGGPTTGSSEDITYSVPVNPNADPRTDNITIHAGNETSGPTGKITVTQDGSLFDVTGPTEKIPVDGSKTVTGSVSATAGLAWTISPEMSDGITVKPTSGSGDTTLIFEAEENSGRERIGSFTVIVTNASSVRIAPISVNQAAGEVTITINSEVVESYKRMTTNYTNYPPFNYDGGSDDTSGTDRNGKSSSCQLSEEYSIEVEKTERGTSSNYVTAINYCKNLGWRIPTSIELKAIYDKRTTLKDNGYALFVDDCYWCSSIALKYTDYRCILPFQNGKISSSSTSSNRYVRCVRDKTNN